MSNSRMVDAVNRLVGNLLAGAGEVALPGVGSLYVQRGAARRISRNSIVPPCRVVAFRSEERGASLVDEIAAAARVDAGKAQEIYRTWLLRVSGENRLTIEGVGELRRKTFVLDAAFDAQLNPQGHAPVRLRAPRRGFDFVLWLGVAAIVFVAGAVGYWWQTAGRHSIEGVERTATVAAAEQSSTVPGGDVPGASETVGDAAETATGGMTGGTAADGEAATGQTVAGRTSAGQTDAAAPAGAASAPAAQPASAAQPAAPQAASQPAGQSAGPAASAEEAAVRSFESGRRYVVLGVFSTEANALRAAREARDKEAALRPAVYRFGGKFLVSPFDAPDAESCTQFIRARADRFPGMWTYLAR